MTAKEEVVNEPHMIRVLIAILPPAASLARWMLKSVEERTPAVSIFCHQRQLSGRFRASQKEYVKTFRK